jgi:hypothetical protein
MTVDAPRLWLAEVLPAFGYALGDGGRGPRQYAALRGTIYEGEGRHTALASYAGLVWVDAMSGETLAALLQVINDCHCHSSVEVDQGTCSTGRGSSMLSRSARLRMESYRGLRGSELAGRP